MISLVVNHLLTGDLKKQYEHIPILLTLTSVTKKILDKWIGCIYYGEFLIYSFRTESFYVKLLLPLGTRYTWDIFYQVYKGDNFLPCFLHPLLTRYLLKIFFFDLGFTALSRIFHLYRADRSSKVGENRRTRRKTTWPSVSRTWLSHMWPEWGSNHSGEKPNGLRINSLIH